ncbi:MAG: hypothetical protein N3A38_03265 [Planctomycetota bacterium]|nr:hypothetical protein [Planctomycetota bacterium]
MSRLNIPAIAGGAAVALFLQFACAGPSCAAERRIEELLPSGTVVFVHVRDVKAATERIKKTPAYALYQEDSVKKFLAKPMGKLREELKEIEAEIGINFEEILGFVSGHVVVAMVRTPDPDKDKDIGLLLAADIGANGKALEGRIGEAIEKLPAGTFEKLTEEAHGAAYTLLRFKEDKGPPELAYCVTGRLFVAAIGRATMAKFLGNLKAPPAESLAASGSFKEAVERIGEDHDFLAFANLKRLIEDLKEMAPPPAEGRPSVDKVLKAVGLDAVQWAAMGATIGEKAATTTWYLKAPGEKRGILKLLSPGGGDLRLPDDLPEDAGIVCAFQFRASDFLDELRDMLNAVDPQIAGQLDMLLGMFQMQAQVDIKKDLFAHVGNSHYFYQTYPKPYQFGKENQVFAAGLKNKEAFRATVGKMLAASGGAVEEKEYLGHKYTAMKMPQVPQGPDAMPMPSPAFGVVGERFVFSLREEGMQDYLRRIGKGGNAGLNGDPAVREVLKMAPRNRVMLVCQDGRKVTEAFVHMMKGDQFKMAMMLAGINLEEYVDMNLLPDVEVLKKYQGTTASVLAATDDGYMMFGYAPYPGR